jgi:predicted permease
VILVVGAGLLATSLLRLYRSGTGFDPRGVDNIGFSMDQQPLNGDALIDFYRQVGEGLRQQPGIKNVSFATLLPFGHTTWDGYFAGPTGNIALLNRMSVAPEYFQTMRIPLRQGRDFAWNDIPSSGWKVILNEAAAKALIPDGDAIGRLVADTDGKIKKRYEVIGIARDAKFDDIRGPAPPMAYYPMSQDDWGQSRSYYAVVRTDGPSTTLAVAAHALAAQILPDVPMPTVMSSEEMIRDAMSSERMMALLSVFFALCALVVTAIGLYGTLAYSTARRTSEIGIRMALGARRTQVARMVFLQNTVVATAGAGAGAVAALLAARALASFLYGTSTRDPWVFAGSILALMLFASAASLLPAIRAAAIEPMKAIRCE